AEMVNDGAPALAGRSCLRVHEGPRRPPIGSDGRGITASGWDGVRERLEIPRFWWRGAERERPRPPARPVSRRGFSMLDLAAPAETAATHAPQTRNRRSWMPVTFGVALLLGGAVFAVV